MQLSGPAQKLLIAEGTFQLRWEWQESRRSQPGKNARRSSRQQEEQVERFESWHYLRDAIGVRSSQITGAPLNSNEGDCSLSCCNTLCINELGEVRKEGWVSVNCWVSRVEGGKTILGLFLTKENIVDWIKYMIGNASALISSLCNFQKAYS